MARTGLEPALLDLQENCQCTTREATQAGVKTCMLIGVEPSGDTFSRVSMSHTRGTNAEVLFSYVQGTHTQLDMNGPCKGHTNLGMNVHLLTGQPLLHVSGYGTSRIVGRIFILLM